MKRIFPLCALLVLALSACGVADFREGEQPVPVRDLVMGKGGCEDFTVEFTLAEGVWFDSDHADAGGGVYPENYSGSYELVLKRDGEIADSLPVPYANVGGTFEILFDDYNGDGAPDFAVGQWCGTNYNDFTLYTIREDALSEIGSVTTTEGKYEQDFSYRFRHENGAIVTNVYDMDLGKQREITYRWDGERFYSADW